MFTEVVSCKGRRCTKGFDFSIFEIAFELYALQNNLWNSSGNMAKECTTFLASFLTLAQMSAVANEVLTLRHADSLASAVNNRQWKAVSLVSDKRTLPVLLKAFSRASISARHSVQNSGRSPCDLPCVLTPSCGESFHEENFCKGPNNMIVERCAGNVIGRWINSTRSPLSFYSTTLDLLLQNTTEKLFLARGETEPSRCRFDFSSRTFPQCVNSAMGAEIQTSVLNYRPFVNVDECVRDNCSVRGIVVDILNILSNLGNFTWVARPAASPEWGTFPSSSNVSEATGMVASTINDEVDFSLSYWVISSDRARWTDFTFAVRNELSHCFTDLRHLRIPGRSFLARPFAARTWMATVFFLFLPVAIMALSDVFTDGKRKKTWGVLSLTGGLAFTVVYAFYGGAMTMFLAQTPEPPFGTILEGLEEGVWTLLLPKGDEAIFGSAFDTKDPTVAAAEQKYNSDEYRETQAATMGETLKDLSEIPRSVFFGSKDKVTYELRDMGADSDYLTRFCEATVVPNGFMLPKNSPYKEVLNLGIMKMYESGELRRLSLLWFRELTSRQHVGVPGVAFRQVSIAVAMFAFLVFAAAVVFCVERVCKRKYWIIYRL